MAILYLAILLSTLCSIAKSARLRVPNSGYANYSASFAIDASGYGGSQGVESGQGYFIATPEPVVLTTTPTPSMVTSSPFGTKPVKPLSKMAIAAATILHDQGFPANLTSEDLSSLVASSSPETSYWGPFENEGRKYSAANPGETIARGPMTAGLQYDPANGYSWLDWITSNFSPPVSSNHPKPKESSEAAIAALNNLLSDTRFNSCDSDASNGPCVDVRRETEKRMVSILNSIDYTLPDSYSQIIRWYSQLGLSTSQTAVLDFILNGDSKKLKGHPQGLVDQMAVFNQVPAQMGTAMDKAYSSVFHTVDQRRTMFDSELARLTVSQRVGAATVKAMANKMAIANQRKVSYAAAQQLFNMGQSLTGVGTDFESLSTDLQSGLDDVSREYSDWKDDYLDQLALVVDQGDPISQQARDSARDMNATYRSFAKLMILTAENQQQDRSSDVAKMFSDSGKGLNTTITKYLTDTSRLHTNDLIDAQLLLRDTVKDSEPKTAQLFKNSKRLVGNSLSALNATLESLMGEANTLVANSNFKKLYLSQVLKDVSKLSNDAAGGVKSTEEYTNDLQSELSESLTGNSTFASNAAKNIFNSIILGIADDVVSTQSDIDKLSNKTAATAQGIKNKAKNDLAGIAGQAAGSAANSLDALSAANAALGTLSGLNDARAKFVSDSASSALSRTAGVLETAFDEGLSGMDEISSAAEQDTAIAARRIGSLLASSKPDNSASSLMSMFAQAKEAAALSAATARSANLQAKQALADLETAETATRNSADFTSQKISDLMSAQNSDFQSLLASTNISVLPSAPVSVPTTEYFSYLNSLVSKKNAAIDSGVATVNNVLKSRVSQFAAKPDATQIIIKSILDELSRLVNPTAGLAPVLAAVAANETAQLEAQMVHMTVEDLNITLNVRPMKSVLTRLINTTESELDEQIGLVDSELKKNRKLVSSLNVAKMNALTKFADLQKINIPPFQNFNVRPEWNDALMRIRKVLGNETRWVREQAAGFNDVGARIENATAEVTKGTNGIDATVMKATRAFDSVKLANRNFDDSVSSKFLDLMTQMGVSANDARARLEAIRTQGDSQLAARQDGINKKVAQLMALLSKSASSSLADPALVAAAKSVDILVNGVNSMSDANLNKAKLSLIRSSISTGQTVLKNIPEFDSEETILLNAQNKMKSGLTPWTDNRANSYKLQGQLSQLSEGSQRQLLTILKKFESGSISLADAVAETKLGPINSADDALVALANEALKYSEMVHSTFEGSNDRLANTTSYIDLVLAGMANGLFLDVATLSDASEELGQKSANFAANMTQVINNDTNTIEALKSAIQTNRDNVGDIMANLATAVDKFEGSLKTNETDYETWVDSTIAKETMLVATKTAALRANTTSLIQRKSLHALHLDMHDEKAHSKQHILSK